MKKILWICCGLTITTNIFAGGFKIALQGIKQNGMGHTGVGFAQDAATIYFNPAGLSFVNPQINGGVNFLTPRTQFLDMTTNLKVDAVNKMYTPINAYGSFRLGKNFMAGVGVYTPFGSGIEYPNWTGNNILRKINLTAIFFQPTIAYKIDDNFSIGGGITVANGKVDLEKNLPITNENGLMPLTVLTGKSKIKAGANVGLYYKQNSFSAGITYHSRIKMNVENGDANFYNIPTALAANFPNTKFNTTLPLPAEVALGIGVRLNKELTLTMDYNYTDWSTFKSLDFDFASNTSSLQDTKSARNYQSSSAIRFGAQYKYNKHVTYRAGFFADQSPVQDGYVAPELPDANKIGLSVGCSAMLADNLGIDLAILYENVPARTQQNIETNLNGTFKTKVVSPAIGVTYLFNKKPKSKY